MTFNFWQNKLHNTAEMKTYLPEIVWKRLKFLISLRCQSFDNNNAFLSGLLLNRNVNTISCRLSSKILDICWVKLSVLLEPVLDVVQEIHGYGVDHGRLACVVLENEDHVEVLDVKLHALKVDQLDFLQGDDKRGLGARERPECQRSPKTCKQYDQRSKRNETTAR